jgi:uncharacterized protein with HEPN domain
MHNRDYYLLLSLLETINKIEDYTKNYNSAEELFNNTKDFDASMMNFIVIGESVGKLSDNIKEQNQQINWAKINSFRIAHHYFGINVDIVWEIINEDLPRFKSDIQKIIKQ